MEKKTMSRAELEQAVLRKAAEDGSFREQLLANPRDTLRTAFGLELPPEIDVRVVQETSSIFYIVLPQGDRALSDAEMEKVAGGYASQLKMPGLKPW